MRKTLMILGACLLCGCVSSTIVPLQEIPLAAPSSAGTQPGQDLALEEANRQSTTQPATMSRVADPNQTTQTIYGGSYENIWRETLLLISRLGFRTDRMDYRQGVITTLPLDVPNAAEFWAPDRESGKSSIESTINYYRRTLRVVIEPLNNYTSYSISVQVLVERCTNPTENLAGPTHAGGSAFSRRSTEIRSDYQLEERDEREVRWYVVGREPGFEKLILQKLLKKI